MKQRVLLGAALLALATFSSRAQAQAVRYAAGGHLAIETQPTDNLHHLSAPMRGNFWYVSYPTYRGQPAGKGWVLCHYLVSMRDSTLLLVAAVSARTYTTTKVVTTRRYGL